MATIPAQIAQPLSRLAARYAKSPVPRFLRWWADELRACLPLRWRQRFRVAERSILLRCEGNELQVESQHGDEVTVLGRLPLAPAEALPGALLGLLSEDQREARRVLLLPREAVLRRTLYLPTAALESLDSVLGFELDRQTPFRADQVRYDSRVLPYAPDARQVPVQLALVTREHLDRELAAIDGLAGTLAVVDVVDPAGRRSGFNLLPQDQRARQSHAFAWLVSVLAALTLLFLWFGMHAILANRAAALTSLTAEVEAQRTEARAVMRLRDELDEAAAGANFLAVEKASQPSMLLLLDELSRRLPDDTFLERLTAARGQLVISGQSNQAPGLVKLLQDAETFRAPALNGSIQPDPRTGKDRFNIAAHYGAESGEDDAPGSGR